LYNLENNNIHGDVKDSTICMNKCFDLVKAAVGLTIQHSEDMDSLTIKTSLSGSKLDTDIQSLSKEAQKNSILENDFIDNLLEHGKDFVLNSMQQQTPSSNHSKFLFKNILNLYEIEYAQFLARHTLGLVENPTVCLSQETRQEMNTDAQKDDFYKMLQANTLLTKNSRKSIDSHELHTTCDSTINQALTRFIVQAFAFTTMFLTTDTASKTSDENVKQFEKDLSKVLEDYIATMQNVQKEKRVFYANNTEILTPEIITHITSIVTTRVKKQIQSEYATIMKKIQRNPDYTSWDLHFFTDEYGPEIGNDEPDSTETSDAMEDCEAESFMSHRVIDAIIAFDVIPNVLKSKWTDVRGMPPIKTYPMPTSDDASNAGSRKSYHTCNNGDHILWSQGSSFPGEEI